VAEDRAEPPFEGGSQPVSHEKDPLPGPGARAMHWIVYAVAALSVAAVLVYVLGRL
jgi:hypothetical protein